MTFNFKTFLTVFVVGAIVLGLGITFFNSSKLVTDFEQNIESKEFIPEANSIEVSETDVNSHRSWKITTEKSTANHDLSKILAQNVSALIFDEDDQVKITIKSPKAKIDRETETSTLLGPAEVVLLAKNTKIIADRFILQKGQPFKASDHVQVFLSEDGKRQIKAQEAIIDGSLSDFVLYQVAKSPVAEEMLVSGGKMTMESSGESISRIIISEGAVVETPDTTCRSNHLNVVLDSNGDPTVAIFTGSPVAVQNGTRIRASRIKYLVKTGQVLASGNVRTEII